MRSLAAGLLAVALAFSPAPVRACGVDPTLPPPTSAPQRGIADELVVTSIAIAGSTGVMFLGLDIGYAAEGRVLPRALGIAQATVGALTLVGSAVFMGAAAVTMSNSCGPGDLDLAMLTSGIALHVLGAWQLAHGIWSAARAASVAPRVAVGPNGAVFGLVASF